MLIYSASLILCFAGSGLYHAVPEEYVEPFGLLDHIGIYLLIAGTVTPIGLIILHGRARALLVGGIWLMAAAGIGTRLIAEPHLSVRTSFYLVMGWIGCLGYFQLVRRLSHAKVAPMWLGGLFYSVGAAINLWVHFPPDFTLAFFSPHAVFHVFVIAGAACHYYFMVAMLIPYRRFPAYGDDELPAQPAVVALTNNVVRTGSAVNAESR
jgi:hemolysin III